MSTPTAEAFLTRERAIKSIRSILPKFREAVSRQSCDKHGIGFGIDDRFSIVSTKVTLSCYTGQYGSSSCSTLGSIGDEKLFTAAFTKYLNKNMEAILNGVADIIQDGLETERQAYLQKLRDEIQRVETSATEDPQ